MTQKQQKVNTIMSDLVPDRYDDLRREWIAEHAGIWTMQKRRAECLNRQIRHRNRVLAGARPSPYDDNTIHPLLTRRSPTPEGWLEGMLVLVCLLGAPLGWPLGLALYRSIVGLIPDRLRAYPVLGLMGIAIVTGSLCILTYSPGSGLATVLLAPYVLAQIPATFAAAGLLGILNGWLAIDGSVDWWPLAPRPLELDLSLPFEPDDLTGPGVFERITAEAPPDLTPPDQTTGSRQPLRKVIVAVLVCLIGSTWMAGAVLAGVKDALIPWM
jgi:hypothetical protein